MPALILTAIWWFALLPGIEESPETIIERLEAANTERLAKLAPYRAVRRYWVNHALIPRTYLTVEEQYHPGQARAFRILERGGPADMERRVFQPLMDAERSNDLPPARNAVDICRRNYSFTWIRRDIAASAHVFQVEPITGNRYLFRGLIWIDERDYGVQRIEGEPAQAPSAWVRRTRFVHEFQRSGAQWIQSRRRSEVDLLLVGHAVMGIDYFDCQWSDE